ASSYTVSKVFRWPVCAVSVLNVEALGTPIPGASSERSMTVEPRRCSRFYQGTSVRTFVGGRTCSRQFFLSCRGPDWKGNLMWQQAQSAAQDNIITIDDARRRREDAPPKPQ